MAKPLILVSQTDALANFSTSLDAGWGVATLISSSVGLYLSIKFARGNFKTILIIMGIAEALGPISIWIQAYLDAIIWPGNTQYIWIPYDVTQTFETISVTLYTAMLLNIVKPFNKLSKYLYIIWVLIFIGMKIYHIYLGFNTAGNWGPIRHLIYALLNLWISIAEIILTMALVLSLKNIKRRSKIKTVIDNLSESGLSRLITINSIRVIYSFIQISIYAGQNNYILDLLYTITDTFQNINCLLYSVDYVSTKLSNELRASKSNLSEARAWANLLPQEDTTREVVLFHPVDVSDSPSDVKQII